MDKHNTRKTTYDEAQELGDPRPQPQVSGADFTDEEIPQNPPPEKPGNKVREDDDKQAG